MNNLTNICFLIFHFRVQPTSSSSTRDTSGSASAPPFFLLLFTFPPPRSSPATASRNLFWLCDLWDLRTRGLVFFTGHPLVCPPFAFPLFAHTLPTPFPAELCQSLLTVMGDMFLPDKAAAEELARTASECHYCCCFSTCHPVILHTVVHTDATHVSSAFSAAQ